MANLYVRSTDGSDADNGTTWALAKASIGGVAAIDSTTDRTIMVSDNHAETPTGPTTWSWAGTKAAPTIVRCVDDSAEPPTTTAATATVVCDSALSLSGAAAYVCFEGISFTSGNGGSTTMSLTGQTTAAGTLHLKGCELKLASTGASSGINLTNATGSTVILEDVDFRFAASGQAIIGGSAGNVIWNGGSLLSGGTSPTSLFTGMEMNSSWLISGLNLSNAGAGIHLCNSTNVNVRAVFRDIKVPDSWSGSFHSGTPGRGSRFSFYNCDSADTNYRMAIHEHFGTIVSETTIVRTGGASDGATTLSWKMVSGADAEWPLNYLQSDEIVIWNDSVGSSKTVTIEVVTDNVTLTDIEAELRVLYLGTSGRPLGSYSSSANTNSLAAGTAYTTSSETWTTTGLGTPVKQYMRVTFTPQEKGFIHAVVRLYRASTTVYVDPELTVA